MAATEKLPRLYTEKQVSEMTGIPVDTLRDWRKDKKGIPYIKLGRSVYYEHDAVIRFIEANRVAVDVRISEELEEELAS